MQADCRREILAGDGTVVDGRFGASASAGAEASACREALEAAGHHRRPRRGGPRRPVRLEGIDAERSLRGGPLVPTSTGFAMAQVVAAPGVDPVGDCTSVPCAAQVRVVFLSATGEPSGRPATVDEMVVRDPRFDGPPLLAGLEASGTDAILAYGYAGPAGDLRILRLRSVRPEGVVGASVDVFRSRSVDWWYSVLVRRAEDRVLVGYSTLPPLEGAPDSRGWIGTCR